MTVSEFAEKALKWASLIKGYCNKRKSCMGCPFMTHKHPIPNYPTGCFFGDTKPADWDRS